MEEKAWYVVHTQTGHEDKVREKILLNIDIQGFGDRVFQVLVPTEEVVEVKQNKKILRKRKFFPGYVLVQMLMTSEAYWFIKNITGVTGFLGDPNPVPLPEEEIAGIVELTDNPSGKPNTWWNLNAAKASVLRKVRSSISSVKWKKSTSRRIN